LNGARYAMRNETLMCCQKISLNWTKTCVYHPGPGLRRQPARI